MTNFNEFIDFRVPLKTTFRGKELTLYHCYLYQGPITLQALPYGGIQSIYQYHLIIYTKSGFVACDEIEYDGFFMTAKEFINQYEQQLVNTVLPN